MLRKREASDWKSDTFQAVCTALAATWEREILQVWHGAIAIGGPGAVFWMWISAHSWNVLQSYSEVTLAVHFRETMTQRDLVGGPMYYIKKCSKKTLARLAYCFPLFGVLTVFGTGNATR